MKSQPVAGIVSRQEVNDLLDEFKDAIRRNFGMEVVQHRVEKGSALYDVITDNAPGDLRGLIEESGELLITTLRLLHKGADAVN